MHPGTRVLGFGTGSRGGAGSSFSGLLSGELASRRISGRCKGVGVFSHEEMPVRLYLVGRAKGTWLVGVASD